MQARACSPVVASMSLPNAFIIAARRTANGRLGGLHRNRRLEDLAAPVVAEALADAGLASSRVGLFALGNTTAGGNPARMIALVAGLPDRSPALTIDRQSASGLEAILAAVRSIRLGEAEVAVAGGAEALSTAPWRLAKPRSLSHLPRFIGLNQADNGESGDTATLEATEALARRLGITRNQQDEFAIQSHIKATLARDNRLLGREIVALRNKAEEGRDELVGEPDIEDMESYPAFQSDGTLTAGNVSLPADGAAFVVVVSDKVHAELGRPPALLVRASASVGVAPADDILSPSAAVRELSGRKGGPGLQDIQSIELGETSAVQAIALAQSLGVSDALVNPDGG
ncbi:MAG: thiolase family protein, partial [Proteobacteria bacterium]|nr:thiolase family protein [Pseudomonadota bacterium]